MTGRIAIAAAIAGLTFGLVCCKPTEKNYQSAYEKAFEAAQRRTEEMNTGSDGTRLESFDAPRMEIFNGDTLLIGSQRVKPFETEVDARGKVGLAVARYTMSTNARRHLLDLQKEYPDAFIVVDGDENYYVIAVTAPSATESVEAVASFKTKHKDYPYIGLGGNPLLLVVN